MAIKTWELLGELTEIIAQVCGDKDERPITTAELLRIDAKTHDLLMNHYKEAFNFGGHRCDD